MTTTDNPEKAQAVCDACLHWTDRAMFCYPEDFKYPCSPEFAHGYRVAACEVRNLIIVPHNAHVIKQHYTGWLPEPTTSGVRFRQDLTYMGQTYELLTYPDGRWTIYRSYRDQAAGGQEGTLERAQLRVVAVFQALTATLPPLNRTRPPSFSACSTDPPLLRCP